MNRAVVNVLRRPPYYGHVFAASLERLGYAVQGEPLSNPKRGDLYVTWNRHERRDGAVKAHEAAGGSVLVVENGYFGRNFNGAEWFALAMGQHNGAGRWPEGDAQRWESLGVELKPWRKGGDEIVILASRGMGSMRCREPKGWSEWAAKELARESGLRTRIRSHPGAQAQCVTGDLETDLANARAVVTWGSTAGLKALTFGVPVFYGFHDWIGAGAARKVGHWRKGPFLGDRAPTFHRVATAMWSLEEIASGKALQCLLT